MKNKASAEFVACEPPIWTTAEINKERATPPFSSASSGAGLYRGHAAPHAGSVSAFFRRRADFVRYRLLPPLSANRFRRGSQ